MHLQLRHKLLNVYSAVRDLPKEVYAVTTLLPIEEKFNLVQQLRRAVLSVKESLPRVQPENQERKGLALSK